MQGPMHPRLRTPLTPTAGKPPLPAARTRRLRAPVSTLCLLTLAAALARPTAAQEPEPEPAPTLKKRLATTPLTFQFLETPARRALDHLAELVPVQLVVSEELTLELDEPITFFGQDMPARRAFHWVTWLAGVDYRVRGNVIWVASPAEVAASRAELHVYDVRDITLISRDFPGPEILPIWHGEEIGQGAMFSAEEPVPVVDLEGLEALIRNTLAPDLWGERGLLVYGERGLLFVTHTPEVHAGVERLLARLRAGTAYILSVEVQVLRVADPAWRELLAAPDSADGQVILDAETYQKISTRAAEAQGIVVLDAARTTCQSAQRVHLGRLARHSYLADIDVEVAQGAAIGDPVIDLWYEGLMADVRPTLTGDRASIVLRLEVTHAREGGEMERIPFGPGVPGEGKTVSELELPISDATRALVTARVPVGGACALAFTEPITDRRDPDRLVLLVQAETLTPEEDR